MTSKFTLNEWKVLNFCEEYSMKNGDLPPVSLISSKTGVLTEKVVEALSSEKVTKALDECGLSLASGFNDNLSEEQIACLQLMYNFSDTRSKKDKLAALGIHPNKYQGWRRTKKFNEAERQVAENLWGEAMPQIHSSVIQEAMNGSIHHQKLAYAIMGRWDEKKNEASMNVSVFLKNVFEVLAEEVGDVKVLERIAKRFDGLTGRLDALQGKMIEAGEN